MYPLKESQTAENIEIEFKDLIKLLDTVANKDKSKIESFKISVGKFSGMPALEEDKKMIYRRINQMIKINKIKDLFIKLTFLTDRE